ncbi:hypothetical protein NDU88_004812 [Pleurodeles waltl]|uniref:Uncharacterized protein n=1 Tax=Pleurodeles waltl TaxID=8319 RepID=A0AAV7VLT4_PLEWA|nr:hypothetical protein NDU88_004812 [Pleurodeles waltl]
MQHQQTGGPDKRSTGHQQRTYTCRTCGAQALQSRSEAQEERSLGDAVREPDAGEVEGNRHAATQPEADYDKGVEEAPCQVCHQEEEKESETIDTQASDTWFEEWWSLPTEAPEPATTLESCGYHGEWEDATECCRHSDLQQQGSNSCPVGPCSGPVRQGSGRVEWSAMAQRTGWAVGEQRAEEDLRHEHKPSQTQDLSGHGGSG